MLSKALMEMKLDIRSVRKLILNQRVKQSRRVPVILTFRVKVKLKKVLHRDGLYAGSHDLRGYYSFQ